VNQENKEFKFKGGVMFSKKKLLAVAVSLLVGLGLVYGSGSNPGSFQISCTPSVTYAVNIDTAGAALSFPTVSVNTTYVNNSTATITNTGNVSADWELTGSAVGSTVWTLGTSTTALNTVMLYGALKTSIPTSADFTTYGDTITTTLTNMSATNFTATGGQNGKNVAVNATRVLSLRLDSPTDTSVTTAQTFQVTITAVPTSTF